MRYRHNLLTSPMEIGLMDYKDPFIVDINNNLNDIERKDTKEKLDLMSKELTKTQYIVPDISDFPFFKETTLYNLSYTQRDMRRTSYSQS